MNQSIIEVKDLTKVYDQGNVLAVDDISFDIKKGEIFALLGPNGAGKTTTISILATLLSLTKGTAFVNDYISRTILRWGYDRLGEFRISCRSLWNA